MTLKFSSTSNPLRLWETSSRPQPSTIMGRQVATMLSSAKMQGHADWERTPGIYLPDDSRWFTDRPRYYTMQKMTLAFMRMTNYNLTYTSTQLSHAQIACWAWSSAATHSWTKRVYSVSTRQWFVQFWNMEWPFDAVESVQRRATGILPELRGLDYEARLRSLKLPTLTYRRLRGDVIHVYKYIHGIYRLPLADNMFEMAQYGATRGHSFKRYKHQSRLNLR